MGTQVRRRKRPRGVQLELFRHGGARRGAGRKLAGTRRSTPHRVRERVARGSVVLLTLRLVAGLPSLRQHAEFQRLAASIRAAQRSDFRVVQASAQSNHLHALVEAAGRAALSSGMNGLLVRIARGLNRQWRRRGPVFAGRYHARVLRTPRELRNALVYVLQNARKHGARFEGPDPFSSAPWFDGWRPPRAADPLPAVPNPFEPARTWLATVGWRRHGRIDWDEVPRPDTRPSRRRSESTRGRKEAVERPLADA